MFIDEVSIKVRAGNGGNGCISFRRAKFEPWGGPNGGDGGKGGDVILVCDENQSDLRDFYFKPHWEAENGGHGLGSDCNGRGGKDCELKVPAGTIVFNKETNEMVAEVTKHGERIRLLKGGNGGWGNMHFVTSVNQAPHRANDGQPGEQGEYLLELKSIADIGLVGFPNAGKSSLTTIITNAKPKTAPYPFTTLNPNIGVIEYPKFYDRLLLADIPGLIEGAHENKGLGHRFLRHVERCGVLVLIIDMAGEDARNPLDDYKVLLKELELYSPALLDKPRFVAANKMDVEESAPDNLKKFKRKYKVPVYPISCLSEEGIPELLDALYAKIRLGK